MSGFPKENRTTSLVRGSLASPLSQRDARSSNSSQVSPSFGVKLVLYTYQGTEQTSGWESTLSTSSSLFLRLGFSLPVFRFVDRLVRFGFLLVRCVHSFRASPAAILEIASNANRDHGHTVSLSWIAAEPKFRSWVSSPFRSPAFSKRPGFFDSSPAWSWLSRTFNANPSTDRRKG